MNAKDARKLADNHKDGYPDINDIDAAIKAACFRGYNAIEYVFSLGVTKEIKGKVMDSLTERGFGVTRETEEGKFFITW